MMVMVVSLCCTSNFGRHGIGVGFKDSSRCQTWLPFRDLHHDAMEWNIAMVSECMNIIQQLSTTSVWKPFSMQWPFWIQPSELPYCWRRRVSLSFPIPVQLNLVTCQKKEKSTVQQLAGFFYVKVKKSNLYQSMLFDDDSLIAGAGQGLFLRPD